MISVGAGTEDEVSKGALRTVEEFVGVDGENDSLLIVESEHTTFMGDSYVDREQIDILGELAEPFGVGISPFSKSLIDIEDSAGLENTGIALSLSIDDIDNFNMSIDETVENSRALSEVISDKESGIEPGSIVSINGEPAIVVGEFDNTLSSMNRVIFGMSDETFSNLIQHGQESSYFGAIVSSETGEVDVERIKGLMGELDLENSELLTMDRFLENNEQFWQRNGTPILFQLIAYIGGLGMVGMMAQRKSELEQNMRQINFMRAEGASNREISKIESYRNLQKVLKSSLVAIPLTPALAYVLNSTEVGLKVGISPRNIMVGVALTYLAGSAGSKIALNRINKRVQPAAALR